MKIVKKSKNIRYLELIKAYLFTSIFYVLYLTLLTIVFIKLCIYFDADIFSVLPASACLIIFVIITFLPASLIAHICKAIDSYRLKKIFSKQKQTLELEIEVKISKNPPN